MFFFSPARAPAAGRRRSTASFDGADATIRRARRGATGFSLRRKRTTVWPFRGSRGERIPGDAGPYPDVRRMSRPGDADHARSAGGSSTGTFSARSRGAAVVARRFHRERARDANAPPTRRLRAADTERAAFVERAGRNRLPSSASATRAARGNRYAAFRSPALARVSRRETRWTRRSARPSVLGCAQERSPPRASDEIPIRTRVVRSCHRA